MLSKATIAWRRLLRDESGQNMIEYALVAALIALGAVVAMQGLGTALSTAFSKVSEPSKRVRYIGSGRAFGAEGPWRPRGPLRNLEVLNTRRLPAAAKKSGQP